MKLRNREYAVAVARIEKHTYDIKKIEFKTIPNGRTYWVADPFPFEKDGKLYIFGEMYDYFSLKGSIAYTELVDGKFTRWKKIIDEPYHLSFPNVFTHDNSIYMCPEAKESGELYLYRCEAFPDKWVKDRVLIANANCTDTVFFENTNGRYALTCEWNGMSQHHMNLISFNEDNVQFAPDTCIHSISEKMSRPAGKIFFDEVLKKNIAVFQNCKSIYGGGLVFKTFDIKYPCYHEQIIEEFLPSDIKCDLKKKFDGIHTFNMSENYVVIDVIWSRFKFLEKYSRVKKKLVLKRGK